MKIRRERTAIHRRGLSAPVKRALEKGVITASTPVFDYGCGRGGDWRRLLEQGIDAAGWDPHYFPEAPKTGSAVVTFVYVANVIENTRERAHALKEAWALTGKVLVVAVRGEEALESLGPHDSYGDGVITSAGTFQTFYSAARLERWLRRHLRCSRVEVECSREYVLAFVYK